MAKPRESAKPDPPVESDEEEEEESGEEDEGSESESEPEPETPQKKASSASAPAPAPKKPDPTAAASSSGEEESESGSDTESGSPVKKPDPNIKPIASKPMDDLQKTSTATKKPRSKPNSSIPTSPTKSTSSTGAKRPAPAPTEAADEGKDAKKPKKKPETEPESSEKKGKLFQRLWSEDDEIEILKGMIDYSAKKKADPVTDLNDFHEFIKKNLHIDVSRTQLQDKIRRLRKKYENITKKERKGNKERTFSKPHEQKTYDLSKKIWGKEKNSDDGNDDDDDKKIIESQRVSDVNGTVVRKSRSKGTVGMTSKGDEVMEEKVKEVKDLVNEKRVVFGYDSIGVGEWVMKDGMEFIKDAKKRGELEEKWKELRVKEIELLARRSELMAEQSKLILDGLK